MQLVFANKLAQILSKVFFLMCIFVCSHFKIKHLYVNSKFIFVCLHTKYSHTKVYDLFISFYIKSAYQKNNKFSYLLIYCILIVI
jgi:hypothetical protein